MCDSDVNCKIYKYASSLEHGILNEWCIALYSSLHLSSPWQVTSSLTAEGDSARRWFFYRPIVSKLETQGANSAIALFHVHSARSPRLLLRQSGGKRLVSYLGRTEGDRAANEINRRFSHVPSFAARKVCAKTRRKYAITLLLRQNTFVRFA